MAWTKLLAGPLWIQWVRTVFFLLLFGEYVRLVLTTEVASYRVIVMLVWGVISAASLVSLVREIRQRSGPHNS